MTGKIIAVANMKGGVGKTTTVVSLAETLAAGLAKPILVVDLDAQANASICLAGDSLLADLIEGGRTVDAFIEDNLFLSRRVKLVDYVQKQISNVTHRGNPLPVSLVASSSHLRLLEREIVFALTERKFGLNAIVGHLSKLMDRQFRELAAVYPYIIIDCAPGISALTEVSIRLADLVIVPTIADFLSTFGLETFCSSLWRGPLAQRTSLPLPKRPPYVLITRKRQTNEHNQTAALMRQKAREPDPAFHIFKTEVPEKIKIAEALGRISVFPTFTNKWGADVVPVLGKLAKEMREALNGAQS
jgi:cellulose biosynthesis protein BcsQ